jgi:hypothetical protein
MKKELKGILMQTFNDFIRKNKLLNEMISLGLMDADPGNAPKSSHPLQKYRKGDIEYFVKFSKPDQWAEYSPDLQTIVEHLAYKIYRLYGIKVPQSYLVVNKEGDSIGIATVGIKGREAGSSGSIQGPGKKDISEGFFVDVLLANWDVMGLVWDNIMVTDVGNAYRIDPGGALTYRAQGARKGGTFSDDPSNPDYGELHTMRGGGALPPSTAGQYFKGMSNKEMGYAANIFENVGWNEVQATIQDTRNEALEKTNELENEQKKSRLIKEIDQEFAEISQKLQLRHAKISEFVKKMKETA